MPIPKVIEDTAPPAPQPKKKKKKKIKLNLEEPLEQLAFTWELIEKQPIIPEETLEDWLS